MVEQALNHRGRARNRGRVAAQPTTMNEFSALGLSQPVVDAIESLGFERPTTIQLQAIPKLLNDDTDFIGLAQTGTGKTAAFGLPLVEMVDSSPGRTHSGLRPICSANDS